ncbi:MAG TPA: prolipoprotein diacylglyceryl transferase [Candidatus Omnitrophota bacterium]|nr:prolipoprotein diacylglyceryl transferase [Candidatus Omnitrophota bacterium]
MEQFINWWQHLPEDIDPVFLQLGVVQIRYYGLMYLFSFLAVYALILYRLKNQEGPFTKKIIDDYTTWAIIGVLLGARLGYAFFYNAAYFMIHPLEVFWPVQTIDGQAYFGISGMSYHGGLIGGVAATMLFCRRHGLNGMKLIEFIVPAFPLGYTFGRLGNFLNGELYGRLTQKWWGMYFPYAPSYELRHPSQLYEAFFEGIVLFLILWPLRKKKLFDGAMFSIYIMGYGIVRFAIEFFRQPDEHIGFVIQALSLGQLLCLVMIVFGIGFFITTKNQAKVKNGP